MDSDYEIERILKEKDFYKMLKVKRTASDEDIKKSYRKIAAMVHPDRCHHEKATQAFQNISHAYKTLIDPDKRNHYNLYGDRNQSAQYNNANHQTFRNQMNPDLYEYMFGHLRQHRPRPRPTSQERNEDGAFDVIWPFFCIIFFFALIMNFNFGSILRLFSEGPSRSSLKGVITFDPSEIGPRSTQRVSEKYNVRYFIPDWWLEEHRHQFEPSTFEKIDEIADELYTEELRIKCELEKNVLNKEGPQCSKKEKILGTK